MAAASGSGEAKIFAQLEMLRTASETLERTLQGQQQQIDRLREQLEETNGWKKSAMLVHSQLEQHGAAVDRIAESLGQVRTELSVTHKQLETHLQHVDHKINTVQTSIGRAEPCQVHETTLAQLSERLDQYFRQAMSATPELWTEINGLKEKVSAVDRASAVLRSHWSYIFGLSSAGGGAVFATIKLLEWLVL